LIVAAVEICHLVNLLRGRADLVAAMAQGPAPAGAVDEDAPHRLGRGAEKVRAILPVGLGVAAEAEPGLVHEGGGLQRLGGGFAVHLGRG
jgi:hypothetical protein